MADEICNERDVARFITAHMGKINVYNGLKFTSRKNNFMHSLSSVYM